MEVRQLGRVLGLGKFRGLLGRGGGGVRASAGIELDMMFIEGGGVGGGTRVTARAGTELVTLGDGVGGGGVHVLG